MKTHDVDILQIAREDISNIYYYISLDNPIAALNMTEEILDKIDTLEEFPERCPIVPDSVLAQQGYRMLIIRNYIAFYKIFGSDVLVYRVLHGKQDYPQFLE